MYRKKREKKITPCIHLRMCPLKDVLPLSSRAQVPTCLGVGTSVGWYRKLGLRCREAGVIPCSSTQFLAPSVLNRMVCWACPKTSPSGCQVIALFSSEQLQSQRGQPSHCHQFLWPASKGRGYTQSWAFETRGDFVTCLSSV